MLQQQFVAHPTLTAAPRPCDPQHELERLFRAGAVHTLGPLWIDRHLPRGWPRSKAPFSPKGDPHFFRKEMAVCTHGTSKNGQALPKGCGRKISGLRDAGQTKRKLNCSNADLVEKVLAIAVCPCYCGRIVIGPRHQAPSEELERSNAAKPSGWTTRSTSLLAACSRQPRFNAPPSTPPWWLPFLRRSSSSPLLHANWSPMFPIPQTPNPKPLDQVNFLDKQYHML